MTNGRLGAKRRPGQAESFSAAEQSEAQKLKARLRFPHRRKNP